jgi:hypothetical protein
LWRGSPLPPKIRPTGILSDDPLLLVKELEYIRGRIDLGCGCKKCLAEDSIIWSFEENSHDHGVSFLVINLVLKVLLIRIETTAYPASCPGFLLEIMNLQFIKWKFVMRKHREP